MTTLPPLPTLHQCDGGLHGRGSDFAFQCQHCQNYPTCQRLACATRTQRECRAAPRLTFMPHDSLVDGFEARMKAMESEVVKKKRQRPKTVRRKELDREDWRRPEEQPGERYGL